MGTGRILGWVIAAFVAQAPAPAPADPQPAPPVPLTVADAGVPLTQAAADAGVAVDAGPPEQAVVDQLMRMEELEAQTNEALEQLNQQADAAREELQAIRETQQATEEERARQAQAFLAAASLIAEADALLSLGSFDADGPLAEAEAMLGSIPGPEASQVESFVAASRRALATRNFWDAREWASSAYFLIGESLVVP